MNIADSVPDPVNPVALTDRLAQMERLQRIVETSDQLMIEIDPSGRFTFVNQAASYYYSVKHESLDTNVSVSCGHWRW